MHIYHMLRAAIDNNETIAMITVIRYSRNCNEDSLTINEGLKLLIWPNGHMYCPVELPKPWVDHMLIHATKVFDSNISRAFQDRIADDDIEYYVEVYPSPIHLIVAGAGHVAKPVVQFGSLLGFYITVICDRPEYANTEQFPWANEVICQPYLDYFDHVAITNQTYILLITRGHKFDVMILRELLDKPMSYLGMIGSRRRISGVFSQLHKEFPTRKFDNIYAPIGLDIGAQTPEEIAISILAEVLAVKNKKKGKHLREEIGHFIMTEKDVEGL